MACRAAFTLESLPLGKPFSSNMFDGKKPTVYFSRNLWKRNHRQPCPNGDIPPPRELEFGVLVSSDMKAYQSY